MTRAQVATLARTLAAVDVLVTSAVLSSAATLIEVQWTGPRGGVRRYDFDGAGAPVRRTPKGLVLIVRQAVDAMEVAA